MKLDWREVGDAFVARDQNTSPDRERWLRVTPFSVAESAGHKGPWIVMFPSEYGPVLCSLREWLSGRPVESGEIVSRKSFEC